MLPLALVATFAGASIQSFTGFGFSLIAAPVFFAVYAPAEAVTIMLTMGTTVCVLVLAGESRRPDVAWGPSARVAVTVVPGVLLGGLVLRSLSQDTLQIAVGLTVIAGALVQATVHAGRGRRGSVRAAYPVGLLSGVLVTATTVGGPVVFLWMRTIGLSGGQVRDSLAAVFLVANLAGIASIAVVTDALDSISPIVLVFVATAVLGHFVGSRLFHRADVGTVATVSLALSLVAGVTTILEGIIS